MATNKLDKTGLAQVWAKITGGFATKQEVQQAVSGVYKFKGSVNFAALPTEGMQPGDVEITYADVSALEHDFGFKPDTSLRDGLRNFAQWYKRFDSDNNEHLLLIP